MLTLEFESNSNKAAEVSILDLNGRVIWKGNNNEGSSFININVNSFINGVYFIQIFDENSKNIVHSAVIVVLRKELVNLNVSKIKEKY